MFMLPMGSLGCMPPLFASTHMKIDHVNIMSCTQEKIEARMARIRLKV